MIFAIEGNFAYSFILGVLAVCVVTDIFNFLPWHSRRS
jgi:hypothetical protein